VFLRELISNANDALEKLRLTALTEKSVWDGVSPLNLTIKAEKNPDGKGGHITITGLYMACITVSVLQYSMLCPDTGIGMSAEELTNNLVRASSACKA